MRQLYRAACRLPEIALGGMERYLPLTKIFGVAGKVFPFPKPYWQHLLWVNRQLIKSGLRCLFQPTAFQPGCVIIWHSRVIVIGQLGRR